MMVQRTRRIPAVRVMLAAVLGRPPAVLQDNICAMAPVLALIPLAVLRVPPLGQLTRPVAPAKVSSGVPARHRAVGVNRVLVRPVITPTIPATPIPAPVLPTAAGIRQTAVTASSTAKSGAITTIPVI